MEQLLIDKRQLRGELELRGRLFDYMPIISVIKLVDVMPTIDAVEVVRCKDCKKYIPCQKLPIGTSKWCDMFDRATCEMNYCGWGERREDADK